MLFIPGIAEGGIVIINRRRISLSEEDIQRPEGRNVAVFISPERNCHRDRGKEPSTNMTMIGSVAGIHQTSP